MSAVNRHKPDRI